MTWLLNLGFAGGNKNPAIDAGWVYVRPEQETIYVVQSSPRKMRQIRYHDEDATTRQHVDFTDWLGSSANISSVAWVSEPSGLTFSNTSNNNKVATAYITGGTYGEEYRVEVTCTTDESVARVYPFSFDLKVARTP